MTRKINPKNLQWFPFYAAAWKYSETVMGMTRPERGIYIDLMVENWMAGDIPWDVKGVVKLLHIHSTVAARFLNKFSTLAEEVRKGCGRYYFPKLHEFALTLAKNTPPENTEERRKEEMNDERRRAASAPKSKSTLTGRAKDKIAGKPTEPESVQVDPPAPVSPPATEDDIDVPEDHPFNISRSAPAPAKRSKTPNPPMRNYPPVQSQEPVTTPAPATPVVTAAPALNDIREWNEPRFGIDGDRLRNCIRFVLDYSPNDYYRNDPITPASMEREKFIKMLDGATPFGWTPETHRKKKSAPVAAKVETDEQREEREYLERMAAK